MGTGKEWDVATGQHSLQSVEIDGDFGVEIGRSRGLEGRDGQDRLAKGGHVQGNPAQIWGSRARKAVEHAPLAAKAAHNRHPSLFPTAARQLNALSLSIPYHAPEKWPALPAGVSWNAHLRWVLGG